MSDSPQTLFEIIETALLQYSDANLQSAEARKRIADEICDKYYTEIDFDIEPDLVYPSQDDLMQQGE